MVLGEWDRCQNIHLSQANWLPHCPFPCNYLNHQNIDPPSNKTQQSPSTPPFKIITPRKFCWLLLTASLQTAQRPIVCDSRSSRTAIMDLQTHPATAAQAKAFTAPGSLSFPTGHTELTPPGDNGAVKSALPQNGIQAVNGTGVTPATPAATPAAATQQSGSGLTPTLQYV